MQFCWAEPQGQIVLKVAKQMPFDGVSRVDSWVPECDLSQADNGVDVAAEVKARLKLLRILRARDVMRLTEAKEAQPHSIGKHRFC